MVEGCTHCGLPLGRRVLDATVEDVPGRYCCFGCILAHGITRARGDDGRAAMVLVRLGVAVFFAMNVMMLTLPTYVPAVYGRQGLAVDGPLFVLLRWLAMAFAAPVLVLLGGPILRASWRAARHGVASADALVVLGTFAAYALSVANTVAGRTAVYFDTAAMLLVLVTLGRYLEARARAETGRLVRQTLAGQVAPAHREGAGGLEEVAPAALVPGDVVLVPPGAAFPADGVVLSGGGGVDEASLTGEALPVPRGPGDGVAGGTCSVDGTFRVRVTVTVAASAPARIRALAETALAERTRVERLADRTATVLVPTVVAIALAAAAIWSRAESVDRGVLVGLAVLVVACPCGLGLAVPLAMWTGLMTAIRHGVVVHGAAVLERLAEVRRVFFDKTGTLTGAVPRVVHVESRGGHAPNEILALAAGLENGLAHPIAKGVVSAARGQGLVPSTVSDLEIVPGHGVRGTVGGSRVTVGSPRWVDGGRAAELVLPLAAGRTPVVVAREGRILGIVWLEETLGAGAAETIASLRAMELDLGVLSGDVQATVLEPLFERRKLWVGLRPEDKVSRVREARGSGVVGMVGDGFNDAPALGAADVGIAVGDAADLARTTADVVVLRGGVAQVPWLVSHARRVARIARQNLVWAFAYNAVAVGLAAAGRLDPIVAAGAMIASSLAVVANARRLRVREEATLPGAPAAHAVPVVS